MVFDQDTREALFSLLHHRWMLLTHAGQSLLNPARKLLLPGKLDLRVLLGHPNRAVAGDF
jgi:hypothetical protein